MCCREGAAASALHKLSHCIVFGEFFMVFACLCLEIVGLYYVFQEESLDKAEPQACKEISVPDKGFMSMLGLPSSLRGFADQWFKFWSLPNNIFQVGYSLYCVWCMWKAFQLDRKLQGRVAESSSSSDEAGSEESCLEEGEELLPVRPARN